MEKNLLEFNFDKISENDIIVFHNHKWVVMEKSVFLNSVSKDIKKLDKKIDDEADVRSESINELNNAIAEINRKLAYLMGEDENEQE